MHLHPAHAVRDLPTLHAFIRAHPLGVLTTSLPSSNFPTLQCSHIPWVLDAPADTGTGASETRLNASTHNPPSLGVLRGHIGRANPQAAAIIQAVTDVRPLSEPTCTSNSGESADQDPNPGPGPGATATTLPDEVLIIFTSPVDHYISPHFYKISGPATGKVAPTWNYAAVQVYGRMRVLHDSSLRETGEWLQAQLGDLARLGEVGVMGHAPKEPETGIVGGGDKRGNTRSASGTVSWTLDDAPERYIAFLKKYVVGMEVVITRVEGRFKVSQEQGVGDREGVVEGLEGVGGERARRMAGFVREKSVI